MRSIVAAVLIFGAIYTAMTSLRTLAGPKGVVVRHGLFGLPRFRYPRQTIARADVLDVRPTRFGLSRELARGPRFRSPLVAGTGPCLRLFLCNGREVVITVTDPYAAADVVNSYLDTSPA